MLFTFVDRLPLGNLYFSSKNVDTLGVLTVRVSGRCLIEVSHGRVRLFRRRLGNLVGRAAAAGARRDCALVVAPRAFSDMVVTFRGRRKGSERFYFDVQISWQAQHFGSGGDL